MREEVIVHMSLEEIRLKIYEEVQRRMRQEFSFQNKELLGIVRELRILCKEELKQSEKNRCRVEKFMSDIYDRLHEECGKSFNS